MNKKIISLLFLFAFAAGCNKEKIYKENLEGVWGVYKYLLNNNDKTTTFSSRYPGYTITFTKDGAFTEFYVNPDSTYVNGTYSFADNDEKIVLTSTYSTFTLDSLGDTTFTTHNLDRSYTIFNLTRDHVQLRNDSSQLYMEKSK